MLFPCKHCGKSYCAQHRLPEKHGCIGVSATSVPQQPATGVSPTTGNVPSYLQEDEEIAKQTAARSASATRSMPQAPREYVWEPNITELPPDPFNPSSGVIIKGIFWPRGKEIFHVMIAFLIMFTIGYLIGKSIFSHTLLMELQSPLYNINVVITPLEATMLPYYLAIIATSSFLIHEFSHRQVGRRYKLPAKFRLLTIGMIITLCGIVAYLAFGFPPFAIPGAVVVIGLENKDQTGKCKIAGPLSNLIITLILLPIAFFLPPALFVYSILLLLGAYINTFLATFNMLPAGILDGHAILQYKKWAWLVMMPVLVGLLVFEIYMLNITLFYSIVSSFHAYYVAIFR
jgi:Zn-dependent protease